METGSYISVLLTFCVFVFVLRQERIVRRHIAKLLIKSEFIFFLLSEEKTEGGDKETSFSCCSR